MRIAILADIHGNLPALHAIMVELERLQPDYVVVNGDLINGVPFSAEVIDFVRTQDWVVVRGNHEFYYLDFGTPRAVEGSDDITRWGQLHWLLERISPAQGDYLGMLPDVRTLFLPRTQPINIAHGVPGHNRVGFYVEQSNASIATDLTDIYLPTVISAHTHVQIDRHIYLDPALDSSPNYKTTIASPPRQWHLVNPGSVGLPLNGDPTAQFAILSSVPDEEVAGGWQAIHYRVPYDRRPSLEAFMTTGMTEAGGVISELFYWELVTAESEIIYYYRWAREHGYDANQDILGAFNAYSAQTGRAEFVRARDPLYHKGIF